MAMFRDAAILLIKSWEECKKVDKQLLDSLPKDVKAYVDEVDQV